MNPKNPQTGIAETRYKFLLSSILPWIAKKNVIILLKKKKKNESECKTKITEQDFEKIMLNVFIAFPSPGFKKQDHEKSLLFINGICNVSFQL